MQTFLHSNLLSDMRIKTFSNYRKRRCVYAKINFQLHIHFVRGCEKNNIKSTFRLHENEIKTNINQENTVNVLKAFSLSHQLPQ